MILGVSLLLFGALVVYAGLHHMSVTDVLTGKPGTPLGESLLPGDTFQNTSGGGFTGGSGNFGSSTKAGGFVPQNAKWIAGRADQGRDGTTDPGGPIIAPGDGTVLRVGSDPGGFGPDYPIVRFSSGPYSGQDLYIGHTHSTLHAGATFKAGAVLSHTGTHGVGNATVPGWVEIGYAPGGSPGSFGQRTPF